MSGPRVLFTVQHLLGMGHLVRASRICVALAEIGFRVTLVSGGMPVPGHPAAPVRRLQLPPLRAGADFRVLLGPDGRPVDAQYMAQRRDALLAAFEDTRPDVLVTEAFPFGRRMLRAEMLPLLARARGRVERIVCSVRDILQRNRKPGRDCESANLIERWYDSVLVHGDPAFIPLEASFPLAGRIARRLTYTGLVAGPAPVPLAAPAPEVVISAGGGAVGAALIETALAARPLSRLAGARWCVITGPNVPAALQPRLADATREGVETCGYRADLPAMLRSCRVSVSQAGYNTVADVLQAGCRAVLVPYAEGGETEQGQRAGRLAELGLVQALDPRDLDARTLASAMDRALDMPRGGPLPELDGATQTAAALGALMCARSA